MRLALIFGVFLWVFSIAHAADTVSQGSSQVAADDPPQLDCPQCGQWQISRARRAGFVGDVVKISPEEINIPNCGQFQYKLEKQSVSPRDGHSRIYRMSFLLVKKNDDILCKFSGDKELKMAIEISGHFREGGTASMGIREGDSTEDFFSAFAWNLDREWPGDAGSGFGSVSAMAISHANLYKVLSSEVEAAYGILRTQKSKPRNASFNLARFSAEAKNFCRIRESESGFGSWPYVWTLACLDERLSQKLDAFIEWQNCMDTKGSDLVRCKFPDEKFDRSPKEE
ncbi:MAG: hypothetical protein V4634_01655 [Pseudomonadota bacterium]